MLSILNALPSAWDHPYGFHDAWSDSFDRFLSAPLFSPSLAWLHATSAPRVLRRSSFLRPVDNEEASCDNSCDCGQLTKPSESSQLSPWRNLLSTSGDASLQDKGDHFELSLSSTGLSPESVRVQVQDDTLHISGESTTKSEEDGYISERWSSFSRHFPLPDGVDQAAITASQNAQGLLTISLPKVQSPAKPELLEQQAASNDAKDSAPATPLGTSKPSSPKSSSPAESKRNTNTNTSTSTADVVPSADDWEKIETPSPKTASTTSAPATETKAESTSVPSTQASSQESTESKSEETCKNNWACAPTPTSTSTATAAATENEAEESPLESLLKLFSPSPKSHHQTQLDVVEHDDSWEVACDVPGVKPEDLKVEFHDGLLTISGQRQSARDKTTKQLRHVERSSGAFSRRIRLPKQLVDEDKITAVHENGELRLTIGKKPLQPVAQPRVIPISSKKTTPAVAQPADTNSTQAVAKQVLSESGKLDPVLADKVASYV